MCLKDITSWMIENKLKNNGDKLEAMLIGTRQQLAKVDFDTIMVDNTTVTLSKVVRNLGVLLDSELTMAPHVSNLCKSGFFQLRDIRAVRRYLDKDAAHSAVRSFVCSRLDYANSLLYGVHKKQLNRLQCVQNVAAKLVMGGHKYDHVTPILRELHWLRIGPRIEYKCTLITWKTVHGLAPDYLKDLISFREDRSHRSRDKKLMFVPRTKLVTGGDRSFSKYAPVLWNALPDSMKFNDDLNSFKSQLKTLLFARSYN